MSHSPSLTTIAAPRGGLRRALLVRLAPFVFTLAAISSHASPAHAYAWMIRHGYTGCVTCHADPSGAGLLTPYGRAQSDLLLRTHYTGGTPEEPAGSAGPIFGLISPPDSLLIGGQLRELFAYIKPAGQPWLSSRVLMQADLDGQLSFGGWRVNGSFGFVQSSASRASVAGGLVSREHWIGYGWDDDAYLIRAGRINIPYGLRILEHTMFVRAATRTDINDAQQHGVAFAYSGELIRGEVMAILGNYQISPDSYRERGYSGYVEITPAERVAVGLSSLMTHAATDLYLQVPDTRQAHGVFTRLAPWQELVLLAEADLVVQAPRGIANQVGYASLLQADVEPLQGVHATAAAESLKRQAGLGTSWALWAGASWFFAPHADVRFDLIRQSDVVGSDRLLSTAILAQAHLFL
jgi:hypothetical protein